MHLEHETEAIGQLAKVVFPRTLLAICPKGLGRNLIWFNRPPIFPNWFLSYQKIPRTFYLKTIPPCKMKYVQQ
jgi:hypothetical protein